MVPEAELEQTEAGLVPASVGWFVMNARDTRWFRRPGRGSLPLTGSDEYEAETFFPMLGMSIQVLWPGEPNAVYHWETEQEDFLVLSGEALLIIEGQERRLDYSVDEAARRHGASPDVETQDLETAYANVPPSVPSRYVDGLLPD